MENKFWRGFLLVLGLLILIGPTLVYIVVRMAGVVVPEDVQELWALGGVILALNGVFLVGRAFGRRNVW